MCVFVVCAMPFGGMYFTKFHSVNYFNSRSICLFASIHIYKYNYIHIPYITFKKPHAFSESNWIVMIFVWPTVIDLSFYTLYIMHSFATNFTHNSIDRPFGLVAGCWFADFLQAYFLCCAQCNSSAIYIYIYPYWKMSFIQTHTF